MKEWEIKISSDGCRFLDFDYSDTEKICTHPENETGYHYIENCPIKAERHKRFSNEELKRISGWYKFDRV